MSEKRSPLDALLVRARRGGVPARVKLDLTNACNLRCIHCCIVPEDRRELDLDEIRGLLDELAGKGCLYLALSGGEIFLRNDLPEIMEEAHRLKFSLRLMTNATLIPDTLIPRFPDLNVGEVAVSLYGDTADLHDRVTQVPGSFEQTVRRIRRMREVGTRVKTSIMLLAENVRRFRETAALAESLDTAWTLDTAILPKHDGSMAPVAHRIGLSDREEITRFIEETFKDLKRMNDRWNRETWLQGSPCGAGSTICSINAYGDVFPCPVMPLLAGNVREQSFAEIWDDSPVMKLVRGIRRRDLKECASCEFARFCVICPGLALAEDGDLFGPSSFHCLEARIHQRVYETTYPESSSWTPPST